MLHSRHPAAATSLLLSALAACSTAPAPTADAAPPDVADEAPIEDASPDVAAPDAPLPDASRDVAPDAATTCDDVSGAWEWTVACNNSSYTLEPSTCGVQTGCSVTDIFNFPAPVVGNVVTRPLDRRLEGAAGAITITYAGDAATVRVNITAPAVVTCTGTGRRLTFPGASRSCCALGRGDCGAGRRCAPVEAGESFFTACVADGTTPAGGGCTRAMDRLGADTCVAGQVCAEDYRGASTSLTCRAACATEGECGAGELCQAYTLRPPAGVCSRRCTFAGSECPSGGTCRPLGALGQSALSPASYVLGCDRVGPRAAGTACTRSAECADGLACQFPYTGGTLRGGFCRPLCDPTHACPSGSTCVNFQIFHGYPADNPSDLGACVPM